MLLAETRRLSILPRESGHVTMTLSDATSACCNFVFEQTNPPHTSMQYSYGPHNFFSFYFCAVFSLEVGITCGSVIIHGVILCRFISRTYSLTNRDLWLIKQAFTPKVLAWLLYLPRSKVSVRAHRVRPPKPPSPRTTGRAALGTLSLNPEEYT